MSESNKPEPDSLDDDESYEELFDPSTEFDAEDRIEYVDTGEPAETADVNLIEEAPGEDISNEMLAEDADRADSWLIYNKGLEQRGYSPAERITKENVSGLSEEWRLETDSGGMQINPSVVPGDPPVMYFNTPSGVLRAINARSGELFWEYQHDAGTSRRTVGLWKDKVYLTEGENVLALNRYTGETEWNESFLWDEDLPEDLADYPQYGISSSCGPVVYDGKVFVGGTTDGIQWGSVQALDAETGEVLWRDSNVVPDGWVENTWAFGSTGSWMPPAIDPETETVVFNTGDPGSYWKGTHRPGPNKHGASVRAFSLDGENKWDYQVIAHELWDYDNCSTPTITDVEVSGEERRVILGDEKDGWMHMLDLETGRLMRRSVPFGRQEHQFGGWPDSEYFNPPEVGEENAGAAFPHSTGLAQWPVDSYSPKTNLRYIGVQHSGMVVHAMEGNWLDSVTYGEDGQSNRAGSIVGMPDQAPYTTCTAIDVDTGEMVWEYEYEEDEGFGWPGGPTSTAGGIVFGPAKDGNLVALGDETGDELWINDTGGGMVTAPVVWDDPAEGAQYVSVATSTTVVTYALEAILPDELSSSVTAPEEAQVGAGVDIEVGLTNEGNASGTVTLEVTFGDNTKERSIDVPGGESVTETVSFDTSSAGDVDWAVAIDGEDAASGSTAVAAETTATTTGDTGPGFGPLTAIAGLGAGAAAAARRLVGKDGDDEE